MNKDTGNQVPVQLEVAQAPIPQSAKSASDDAVMRKFLGWSIIGWGSAALIWVIIDLIWHHEMFMNSIQGTIYLQTYDGAFIVGWNQFWFGMTDWLWSYWPFIAVFAYPDKRVGNFFFIEPEKPIYSLEDFHWNSTDDVAKE
jgi:hypothetical protein